MVACASRSLLIVNEETPASYLPEPTPAMIESNDAVWNLAFRPSFAATSWNRSTSNPTIVFPSGARNSLGAYVVSLPTLMTPSPLTAAGTSAASDWSAETLGSAPVGMPLLLPPPPLLPEPEPELDEPLPQPVMTRAVVASVAVATARRRGRDRESTADLLCGCGPLILPC